VGERLDVTDLGNGRYRVTTGIAHRLGYAVRSRDATWVFLDGRVYVFDRQPRRAGRARQADDELALAAPMPATVVLVNVAPGQEVSPGDVLVVLEAMKMELPITAPRQGRVKAVACRPGELVQPGVPLLELE
jgi:biotin carboxyl carrier protein